MGGQVVPGPPWAWYPPPRAIFREATLVEIPVKFKCMLLIPPILVLALVIIARVLAGGQEPGGAVPIVPPDTAPFSLFGIITIMGVMTTSIATLITLVRAGRVVKVVDETKKQTSKIEILVDGRYGEVLQELANVQLMLAESTKRKADMDRAAKAQERADEHKARLEKSQKENGQPQ